MSGKTILSIAILVATGCAWAETDTWKVPSWQAFRSAPDAVKKVINDKDGKIADITRYIGFKKPMQQ